MYSIQIKNEYLALKEEVYNYIIKLRRDRPNKVKVDFRAFQSAVDARIGNPEGWVDMVKLIVDYQNRLAKAISKHSKRE